MRSLRAGILQQCRNQTQQKVRYIRDWSNGSNVNNGNYWVEMQAFIGGINVALKKPVTSNFGVSYSERAVDNNTNSNPYVFGSLGVLQYLQVDLGTPMDVSQVKIWRYFADHRIFNKTKTEVSSDGITWVVLFDSSIEGTYVETEAGRTYTL